MKVFAVIVLTALVVKDADLIGAPLVVRGISQGLALLVGMYWLLFNINSTHICRYWPVFGYLLISFVSSILSSRMEYAFVQSLSLLATIAFAMAYFQSAPREYERSTSFYFVTVIVAYSAVCIASLILYQVTPSAVYSRVGDWLDPNAGMRFSGIFPTAGMMAVASGLLVGLTLFRRGSMWWRFPLFWVGLGCLALTQSRTFWLATLVAFVATLWIYRPKLRISMLAASMFVVLTAPMIFSIEDSNFVKAVRLGSIENLTGRIPLWEASFDAFWKKPMLGHGTTVGAQALSDSFETFGNFGKERDDRSIGRETIHNGYIQSLLDLGIVGFFFYVAVFGVAILRIYSNDVRREYAPAMFGLVFFAVANLGESVVYSASVSHAIVFWFLVVLVLARFHQPDLLPRGGFLLDGTSTKNHWKLGD
ncbi:MAG: O-antigen ligase family protein [Pseudomonadota bacterium]